MDRKKIKVYRTTEGTIFELDLRFANHRDVGRFLAHHHAQSTDYASRSLIPDSR